ncbi:hypothetical protein CGRA01v4_04732 [Colletotrichum graminicola]|nr:hypothetical protein CGRA01v4_04732 [Colletotrichum graminicola]
MSCVANYLAEHRDLYERLHTDKEEHDRVKAHQAHGGLDGRQGFKSWWTGLQAVSFTEKARYHKQALPASKRTYFVSMRQE